MHIQKVWRAPILALAITAMTMVGLTVISTQASPVHSTTVTQVAESAVTTAAAVPHSITDIFPSITFGWVIYLNYTHKQVGSVLLQAFVAGAGAAAALVCATAGIGFLGGVCAFIFAFATAYMIGIMQQAYSKGTGIVLEFTYAGTWFGYLDANWTPVNTGPICPSQMWKDIPCVGKGITV